MASDAIFIGWNRAIVGREVMAMETFGGCLAYWAKQQAAGNIESFEPVLITPHGGDLNGFVLVRGDHDKLQKALHTDEWEELFLRANFSVDGMGVGEAHIGEGLQKQMGRWQKIISK